MSCRISRAALAIVFCLLGFAGFSQTFRSGITGTITDASSASSDGANVPAINVGTGLRRETTTSTAGEFAFPDLPLDQYQVTASHTGFDQLKMDQVAVEFGKVTSLRLTLKVASQSQSIEVAATAGAGSINGARIPQSNWRIDGADNNDLCHNSAAVNQGGVSGIAGTLLPIDAIDQFSIQRNLNAEGRNGGTVTVASKGSTLAWMVVLARVTATPNGRRGGTDRLVPVLYFHQSFVCGGPVNAGAVLVVKIQPDLARLGVRKGETSC